MKKTITYHYYVVYENTEDKGSLGAESNTKLNSIEKIKQLEEELSKKNNNNNNKTIITNFILLKITYAK